MLAAPFKVVLDANVLYPFTLRDTLLRAAFEDIVGALAKLVPAFAAAVLEHAKR